MTFTLDMSMTKMAGTINNSISSVFRVSSMRSDAKLHTATNRFNQISSFRFERNRVTMYSPTVAIIRSKVTSSISIYYNYKDITLFTLVKLKIAVAKLSNS